MGGGYLTESYPTNFPHFYKRKMLTATEKITDFREVTATEKQALESKAANFNRPPQSFIDQWNVACGDYGCWNESTGYFELNGLKDISYSEAIEIMAFDTPIYRIGGPSFPSYAFATSNVRTVFPIVGRGSNGVGLMNGNSTFKYAEKIEVIIMREVNLTNIDRMFWDCKKLRKIEITLGAYGINSAKDGAFYNCFALEDVKIGGVSCNLDFSYSPRISRASFEYMFVRNTNITFTVHPLVYAKIMGTSTETMTEDEKAQWEALLPLAQERNVTIATV